eukprot:CAMPEP_0171097158 /NCGR_PEP_ID=MMETSP0766_2-20121228/47111_1 /TAXON_ID=439317 /ORGANISM="Gambierdiscus australes, Strain CAWD 149" /LENGTH=162 /DNA_ID=CAMNT_0011556307 /DNA_START=60 /DNA_END=548 /DNA_ORIENTATION=+
MGDMLGLSTRRARRGASLLLAALVAISASVLTFSAVTPSHGSSAVKPGGSLVMGPSAWARMMPVATAGTQGRSALQAEKSYWEGEWICADCGYIYNERVFGQKFEDLQAGFKCPACAAPRRRFARKLGDKIGTTLDGGDTPILIFSAAALVAVLAIAYFALQ